MISGRENGKCQDWLKYRTETRLDVWGVIKEGGKRFKVRRVVWSQNMHDINHGKDSGFHSKCNKKSL